jgi:hypothetical protein
MANVRCFGSRNMLRIRDRVEGARVAPATPRSARLAMSIPVLVENAASTEASELDSTPVVTNVKSGSSSP